MVHVDVLTDFPTTAVYNVLDVLLPSLLFLSLSLFLGASWLLQPLYVGLPHASIVCLFVLSFDFVLRCFVGFILRGTTTLH